MQASIALPEAPRQHGRLRAVGANRSGHAVQFYEGDEFLFGVVGDFLAAGLARRQPAIVIATEPHRAGFVAQLRSRGMDVDGLRREGRLILLDARETLDAFMASGSPDPDRFRREIGSVVERALAGGGHPVACAYGEMVDLLWKDGNPEGALQLEALWNELAQTHAFSLLCAYAIQNFATAADSDPFLRVCTAHQHVEPTERYTQVDDDARLREISALQ